MKLFANLVLPIITLVLFILNTYWVLFVLEKSSSVFLWWVFSTIAIFLIMGTFRWYVDEKRGK